MLFAAFLHAVWNAMVKSATDRALVIGAVSFTHALFGLVLICVSPAPLAVSWSYILASSIIHYGYYFLMFQAYRLGDLSQVYPISRGLAPVLVALGAYLAIGESLSPAALLGLGAVSFGIMLLAFNGQGRGSDPRALVAAAANGVLIASYSVVDGIGIRLSENPFGYMGWLFLLEFPVPLFVAWRRRAGSGIDLRTLFLGLGAGVFAVLAYALVLYAKTIAPLGAVSAVRESSVIIAALIGVLIFAERPWPRRLLSAAVVAAGVSTLAFSG